MIRFDFQFEKESGFINGHINSYNLDSRFRGNRNFRFDLIFNLKRSAKNRANKWIECYWL